MIKITLDIDFINKHFKIKYKNYIRCRSNANVINLDSCCFYPCGEISKFR